MKKDRVKHIRSRPHHPMTLGKIERFWKSILGEFLQRAQFDSFEQAVERTAFWVKYYNHKRPHQGIGGLCPADRFFEIAHDLKKTLQRGVEENVLELALRGRPVDPFYMVGRMFALQAAADRLGESALRRRGGRSSGIPVRMLRPTAILQTRQRRQSESFHCKPVSTRKRSKISTGPIFFASADTSILPEMMSRAFSENLEREWISASTRPFS
jgi:hypothetical protein